MGASDPLQLAIDSLLSPPVLGFALGLLAVAIGGDGQRRAITVAVPATVLAQLQGAGRSRPIRRAG
ncbi:MAG: hypothetical protein FJW81_10740 [Actinobacteria bacterium]|nr:hypothetical protein [Actinomycetota bacterium]